MINHGFQLGEKALRRNQNFPDEPQEWIEFTFNQSYLDLATKYPDEFKGIEYGRWVIHDVQCLVCRYKWRALYGERIKTLECDKCRKMVSFKIINKNPEL